MRIDCLSELVFWNVATDSRFTLLCVADITRTSLGPNGNLLSLFLRCKNNGNLNVVFVLVFVRHEQADCQPLGQDLCHIRLRNHHERGLFMRLFVCSLFIWCSRLFICFTRCIVFQMEIAHPAAKMVVMAAGMQETEVN